MKEFNIDPVFRDKIPPMPKGDFDGLREDIIRDGYVRDPLVVWDEENTLLDGHNRWKIICENWELLKGKYKIDRKSFPDRWAAIAWICANQLHKHNMTELQRLKLIQEEHDASQHSEKFKGNQYVKFGGGKNLHNQVSEAEHKNRNKTRAVIAEEHKVTLGAVKVAVEVGRGIDKAAAVDPAFKREVLSGELKARKADLAAIRNLESPEDIAEAIEEIRNPTKERKKRGNPKGFTKEQRAEKAKIAAIVEDMYDRESVMEFTIDDLVTDIRINAEAYISVLRNTLADRNELLTEGNRPIIANTIDEYVINKIYEVKGLLK